MKSAKKDRVDPAQPGKETIPRRPWPLIALGAASFTFVLIVGLDRAHWRDRGVNPEQKVYSSAAESFEPMAVANNQIGKLDPPGVNPLRLFAVTLGRSSREGLAVLGAAEASSRTYVAGALLENGAKLSEVYADHVVLVRGAKNYKLYLPQKGQSDQLADSPGLTIGGRLAEHPPLIAPVVRVSDAVRVAPVYDGTQITGFSVYPGARAGQFERWGLKSGDVLISLNGQPLTSSEHMEALLDQVAQGVSLTGEVRRGGELIAVTLDGSALLAAASTAASPPPPP
jgi:type II secretion system protein C